MRSDERAEWAPLCGARVVEPLIADHVLEFPGGYTRSVGPVIGGFLTELRDGHLVGVRTADGRVLVPPTEYDPDSGESVTGELVPVGPAGTVTAWSWVTAPREEHPLDRPFAWALVHLDGADTALLHCLDFGAVDKGDTAPPKELAAGLRVRPRWRAERTGRIVDIDAFEPEVTGVVEPSRLDFRVQAGRALTRFLEGVGDGVFLGSRCGTCGKVYVPLRGTCPADGAPIEEEVPVSDTGTVTTFAVNNVPDPRAPEVPFVSAQILLDGADIAMVALVGGIAASEVRMGMRVRAVWVPPEERGLTMENIKWFEPTGEPDADYESYGDA